MLPVRVNLADKARTGEAQDYSDWLGVQMGNYQLTDMLAKSPMSVQPFSTAGSQQK